MAGSLAIAIIAIIAPIAAMLIEFLVTQTYWLASKKYGTTLLRHNTQEEVMPHRRNHVSKEPKPSKMNKAGKEQLRNVISLRVSDEEKRSLEKLTKSASKNISEIMREAIDLWSYKRRKLCMN